MRPKWQVGRDVHRKVVQGVVVLEAPVVRKATVLPEIAVTILKAIDLADPRRSDSNQDFRSLRDFGSLFFQTVCADFRISVTTLARRLAVII